MIVAVLEKRQISDFGGMSSVHIHPDDSQVTTLLGLRHARSGVGLEAAPVPKWNNIRPGCFRFMTMPRYRVALGILGTATESLDLAHQAKGFRTNRRASWGRRLPAA